MAIIPSDRINDLKKLAKAGIDSIDKESLKENAAKAAKVISEKATDVKELAIATKDDIEEKLTELDRMLASSITEYNDAYTQMNDKGVRLYVERCRAVDTIAMVESIINSIANHPKSFDAAFEEINVGRKQFIESCEFANRELLAAREAAGGAGAGLAAGASVAFMAPTAAMWIATTFGTASTGTAISALSGAAASNAALAWLGGGAVAAGGGGVAAGNALLALAGPVGWTIAGAALLTSIIIFTNKKTKLNKEKNDEIETVKKNTERIKEMDAEINALLTETTSLRKELNESVIGCMRYFGADYNSFNDGQKIQLGSLVNCTKALSTMFTKTVNT